MDRVGTVAALREIGRWLELRGDDPFRARAYGRAADAIDDVFENLDTLVSEGRLTEVEGVGKAIAALVTELYSTGRSKLLDSLRAEMPAGWLELADVSRLSPAKLKALRDELGVTTVDGLEAACLQGRVSTVRGFGAKTEEKLLARLVRARSEPRGTLLVDALAASERMARDLRRDPAVRSVHLAGAARRGHEVLEQIDLVVETDEPEGVLAKLSESGRPLTGLGGPAVVVGERDAPLSVWIVRPAELGTVLHRATGALAHVEQLARLAAERGVSLDGASSEAAVYERVGLPAIPAELREGQGEIEAALQGRLPADLLTVGDVRGMVHCHTTDSDGRNDVAEMARAAEAAGFAYLTITDHSPNAFYARGVSVERLRAQWEEIARVQQTVGIRILRGMECDILPSGEIDCPDDVIAELDVVIASIHARGGMNADQMTARIVQAMRHPCFKIWGHPLGRILGRRAPVDCRVEEILDVIATSRAAIEINADPHRLDLEPRWLRAAAERRIPFVVSTDAHSTAGMGCLPLGVTLARRAGLGRGQVLNTRELGGFLEVVRP